MAIGSKQSEEKQVRLGVVIPTKNRLEDLVSAVKSIIAQSRKPEEIIIVDQSSSDIAREHITRLISPFPGIRLRYLLDASLTGLTAAKNRAIKVSESDILLFIDDDIVLEKDFVEIIMKTYERFPDLSGVGGIVRLPAERQSFLKRIIAPFFQIGPFRDVRALIQAGYMKDQDIVRTWLLSGGLSSLKVEVFKELRFNEALHGASPIEDMEFYSRASKIFNFALATKAIAIHNVSFTNRSNLKRSYELKTKGFSFIFAHYVKKTFFNRIAFWWRKVGLLVDALYVSASRGTLDPLRGVFSGWKGRV